MRGRKLRLRHLLTAACAAVGLLGLAAPVAGAATWQTSSGGGAVNFTSGQSETIALTANTLFGLQGTVAGTAVKISATGLSGVSTKITQTGTSAQTSGKWLFTGTTVNSPANCTLTNLETKSLTGEMLMGNTGATSGNVYLRLLPVTGTTFATFTLSGGSCVLAGTPISLATSKGVYGQFELTGTLVTKEHFLLTPAVNSSQGGDLSMGGGAASMLVEAGVTLSGTLSGRSWGVG
jgi:hypothetical protein